MDKDGFPVLPPGGNGMISINGRTRMTIARASLPEFAMTLGGRLGKPVKDATGLTGKYEFTLSFVMDMPMGGGPGGPGGVAPPPPPPPGMEGTAPTGPIANLPDGGPTIFAAVQQQLGLKLDSKKGQVDVIVIDHIEKVPTEN